MKTRLLTLAMALLTAINVLANVNVRTNGGPVQPGTVLHLSWQRPSPTQLSDVDVSYDGGSTWEEIAAGLEQDTLLWKIPAVKFVEVRFRVRTQREIRSEREIGGLMPRDPFIRSRGYSQDGTFMYAIEVRDSYVCRVLRTDLTTLNTICLWKETNSTCWGKISPDAKYAVLSVGNRKLVVLDLQTGAVQQRAMIVHDLDFLNDGAQIATLEGDCRMSIIETSTLDVVTHWQPKKRVLPNLFTFGDKCFVRYHEAPTLVFTASDTVGTSCGAEIDELAYGLGYNRATGMLTSLTTMSDIEDVGSGLTLMSTSNSRRYAVFRSTIYHLRTVCVFDILTNEIRWATLNDYPQQCPVFIADDGLHLVQSDNAGTSIYKLSPNGATFVSKVGTKISSITPTGTLLAFNDSGIFAYTMNGASLHYKFNLMSSAVNISDDGNYALTTIESKFVVVNTRTGDYFAIKSSNGNVTSIRWSQDGKEAAFLSGNELHIVDLVARTSRIVAESGLSDRVNSNLTATPDLDIIVAIWDGRRALVYNRSSGASNVVVNNGLSNSVMDCKIDRVARRVYFRAKLINWYSPLVLVYTDVDKPHYIRPVNFKASPTLIPSLIHSYTVNDVVGYVLTFEWVNGAIMRVSAWDLAGELVWTKNIQLALSDMKGAIFTNGMQRLVLVYPEGSYVFNAMTGEEVHNATTYLLGDALGGRAYLSRHATTAAPNAVQLHLYAQNLTEFIPLPYVVRDRWSIRYSQNTLIYNTDSTWMIVRNPAAEFDEAATMYSVPLQRSIVTSVRMIDHNVQIEAETSGHPVSTSLVMFDLQGRMLAEHNDIDLRSGSTDVFVGGEQLPRQIAVQILYQGQLLFSGVLFR